MKPLVLMVVGVMLTGCAASPKASNHNSVQVYLVTCPLDQAEAIIDFKLKFDEYDKAFHQRYGIRRIHVLYNPTGYRPLNAFSTEYDVGIPRHRQPHGSISVTEFRKDAVAVHLSYRWLIPGKGDTPYVKHELEIPWAQTSRSRVLNGTATLDVAYEFITPEGELGHPRHFDFGSLREDQLDLAKRFRTTNKWGRRKDAEKIQEWFTRLNAGEYRDQLAIGDIMLPMLVDMKQLHQLLGKPNLSYRGAEHDVSAYTVGFEDNASVLLWLRSRDGYLMDTMIWRAGWNKEY